MAHLIQCYFAMALAVFASNSVIGDPYDRKKSEIWDRKFYYSQAAGREATERNIIESLEMKDAAGRHMELTNAIDLAVLLELDRKVIEPKLLACYEAHPSAVLRAKCLAALVSIESKRGAELAEKFLQDRGVELEYRGLLAQLLAIQGKPIGYPVLLAVVDDPKLQRLARDMALSFRPLDGQPWNKNGDRVDLVEIARKLEKK